MYGLVKGVEGIDYSTGDVKLTIDGTEKESLRNLKEKLIQSLITERDKTEGLVRLAVVGSSTFPLCPALSLFILLHTINMML